MTRHTSRPLAVSGGLSVVAGLLAILLVADGPAQRVALGIGLVGLVGIAVGTEALHRDHALVGVVTTTGGVAGVFGALWWGATRTVGISPKLELLPGVLGLVLLVLGLASTVPGYERWVVTAGTGVILLAVFVSGLLYDAPVEALLAGTAATVVAWDFGEQAINMGEQVGRRARTWPVELVHGGSGVTVGGIAVLLAIVINDVGVSGLPLAGLSILLGAAVVLTAALYN